MRPRACARSCDLRHLESLGDLGIDNVSCVALEILESAHALRESEEANEARRVALLVDVVLAEGDEALVVQCLPALATGDRDRTLEETQRDRTGDSLLRCADERVVGLALGRPPAAFVHEIRVARRDEILGGECAAVEHELLELGVRELQQRAAGGLVNAEGFHSDQAIFDEIYSPDAVPSAYGVELLDQSDGGERLTVDGDRGSCVKADDHVIGSVWRACRIRGEKKEILRR